MKAMRTVVACIATLLTASTSFASLSSDDVKRLDESAAVLSEMRTATDGNIPGKIWNDAKCVVVIPSLKKAAFILGGEFGSGVMSCRHAKGWTAPLFMKMTKGSAGFQIGAQSIDLVLLVMNQSGVEKLLRNQVTLGADASIAAGPVGRAASAGTDVQLTAEMLAYSRTKGLFAGIDLSGGSLRPNESANERAYGVSASVRDIALGTTNVAVPIGAERFMTALRGREVRGTSGVKKGY